MSQRHKQYKLSVKFSRLAWVRFMNYRNMFSETFLLQVLFSRSKNSWDFANNWNAVNRFRCCRLEGIESRPIPKINKSHISICCKGSFKSQSERSRDQQFALILSGFWKRGIVLCRCWAWAWDLFKTNINCCSVILIYYLWRNQSLLSRLQSGRTERFMIYLHFVSVQSV